MEKRKGADQLGAAGERHRNDPRNPADKRDSAARLAQIDGGLLQPARESDGHDRGEQTPVNGRGDGIQSIFFRSDVGFGRLHIRDWPRCVDLHGCVSADQRPAHIVRDRRPPPEKAVAANIPGILRPTDENCAHIRSADHLLHLHPAAARLRAAVELGGEHSRGDLQRELVAEYAVHSQLLWI